MAKWRGVIYGVKFSFHLIFDAFYPVFMRIFYFIFMYVQLHRVVYMLNTIGFLGFLMISGGKEVNYLAKLFNSNQRNFQTIFINFQRISIKLFEYFKI